MSTSKRVETPVFVIEEGTLVRERDGSRTNLAFTAKAARQLECAFELFEVRLLMFDKAGHFLGRGSAQRMRNVLSNRAHWQHEVPSDQLAYASRIKYEIEYRYDTLRKVIAGEIPTLAADSDTTEWFRWLSVDPRSLQDRCAKYQFTLWARPNEVVFAYGCEPMVPTDQFESRFELDFLDQEHHVVLSRTFQTGQYRGATHSDDNVYNFDRKTMRTLKFFELRVHNAVRSLASLELTL